MCIDIAHRRTYKQWLWLRGRNKKSHHLQPTNYRTLTNTYVNISIHSVQYDRKSSPVLNISSLFWRSSLLSFRHHFRTGWGHFRAITNFFIIATSWLVEKFPRHLKPYGRELNSDKKYDTYLLPYPQKLQQKHKHQGLHRLKTQSLLLFNTQVSYHTKHIIFLLGSNHIWYRYLILQGGWQK